MELTLATGYLVNVNSHVKYSLCYLTKDHTHEASDNLRATL